MNDLGLGGKSKIASFQTLLHSTLGSTPAIGLKLAGDTWTIEKLIEEVAN
jgi:hypothetical protein